MTEYVLWWDHDNYVGELRITATLYDEGVWEFYNDPDMPKEVELLEDPMWSDIRVEDVEGDDVVGLSAEDYIQIKADLSELYWDEEPWKYG